MPYEDGFMTNTLKEYKPVLNLLMKKFPGAIKVVEPATDRRGDILHGHVAVHIGDKPLPDYGEVWTEYDRLLRKYGLRV